MFAGTYRNFRRRSAHIIRCAKENLKEREFCLLRENSAFCECLETFPTCSSLNRYRTPFNTRIPNKPKMFSLSAVNNPHIEYDWAGIFNKIQSSKSRRNPQKSLGGFQATWKRVLKILSGSLCGNKSSICMDRPFFLRMIDCPVSLFRDKNGVELWS
jgi:hypothetical protein